MGEIDDQEGDEESEERELRWTDWDGDQRNQQTAADGRGRRYRERERERKMDGVYLDRSPSNGSGGYSDDIIDPDAPKQPGVTDEARTTFYEKDVGNGGPGSGWNKLWAIQHDNHSVTTSSKEYREQRRQSRRNELFSILVDRLHLSASQEQKAKTLFDDFDMTGTGVREEAYILAAISLACDHYERPIRWAEDDPAPFREIQKEDLGIATKTLRTARNDMKENTNVEI